MSISGTVTPFHRFNDVHGRSMRQGKIDLKSKVTPGSAGIVRV